MRRINPETLWYSRHPLLWLLFPFALIYEALMLARRYYLQRFCQKTSPVPIIVVGNLTVGGAGKTPLVIALAKTLQARGLRVGIVSRGYGAAIRDFPHCVNVDDAARQVGDEPLLLAKKTGCPVVIAPDRMQAVHYLLDHHESQVIISDDGLQHYKMGRAIEIAVIDGVRGLGNGLCLPAGPLRESARRLKQVDFVVVNGGEWPDAWRMDLQPGELIQLSSGKSMPVHAVSTTVAAVAAIGHPERFFATLRSLGMRLKTYSFPDHHAFHPDELCLLEKIVVMTEKDAVKCQVFATDTMYFLPVDAVLSRQFWDALLLRLDEAVCADARAVIHEQGDVENDSRSIS